MQSADQILVDIQIDCREERSGIGKEIERLSDKLSYRFCTLPTGDYWIGDKLIIERKAITDFLNSIKNGRIFQQAYRMAQSGKNALLIIEGNESMFELSGMTRNAVQGTLVHLVVFAGIPVLRSENIQETAFLLCDIIKQSKKQELPRRKHIISKSPGLRASQSQRKKIFLLQNLPGIGTKKALALLAAFKTVENIITASATDLTEVHGIGKKLAAGIYAILHEPY